MKKTHVELWAFDGNGNQVASGLVTPAGVCGAISKVFPVRYGTNSLSAKQGSFGYGVTDATEVEWKHRMRSENGVVRFQRVLVDF